MKSQPRTHSKPTQASGEDEDARRAAERQRGGERRGRADEEREIGREPADHRRDHPAEAFGIDQEGLGRPNRAPAAKNPKPIHQPSAKAWAGRVVRASRAASSTERRDDAGHPMERRQGQRAERAQRGTAPTSAASRRARAMSVGRPCGAGPGRRVRPAYGPAGARLLRRHRSSAADCGSSVA